ncbi:MAG TPA: SHOCT domain-containing protein, partial [Rubrivivax sp.]|nr:SHOCT domain-containing protein [Rubrivivax sp.]
MGLADELTRLQSLRDSGALSDDEFQRAKARVLAGDEPPPFEIANAGGASALVLVCDHASHRVPRALHHLGLAPAPMGAPSTPPATPPTP